MMHTNYDFHPAFSDMSADVKVRAGLRISGRASNRRLYLSRRHLPNPGWHRLANADEVERAFELRGFEIVHPQELPIHAQLNAYHESAVLAGEYGSAVHNAIFCRRETTVIVLNEVNRVQRMIATANGQRLIVIAPADGILRTWETHAKDGAFAIDVDALDAVLGAER